MMLRFLSFLALAGLPLLLEAQNNPVRNDAERDLLIEKLMEMQAENTEENIDYTTVFQDLIDLYENPLNLNDARREDLDKFRFLTTYQIANWWEYLEKYRPVYSPFELAMIKGFDEETVRSLMPFISFNPSTLKARITAKQFFKGAKNELFIRYGRTLQRAAGYAINEADPASGFLGSPDAFFVRYRFRYKDKFSMGFTADKDPGEPFFQGAQKMGFDFYSAHVFVRDVSFFKQIAVGDFKAQFGQGLVFWTGLAFGKSAFVSNLNRNGSGISPFTSVNESLFLRGGGITLNPMKGLDVTLFSSYKNLGGIFAGASDSLADADLEITSLPAVGLHRTQNEISRRRNVSEWISGGNISYRTGRLKLGVTALYTKLGASLNPPDELYRRYEFQGRELGNAGLHYQYVFRNFSFFGEGAWSSNGGWAVVNGIQANPVTFLSVNIYHRYFSNRYTAFYSAAISESAQRSGEQGFYFGLDCKPAAGVALSGFMDIFQFSWLRYQTNSPVSGYDVMGQAAFRPSRRLDFYLRYRLRSKPRNVSGDLPDPGIKPVEERETGRLRFHLNWQYSARWRFQSRFEWVRFKRETKPSENGYLGYLDVSYSALKKPLSLHARFEVFHTDGFDTRLYAYESDVLYFYSFVPLYDKGFRTYLAARWEIGPNLDVWFKVANTAFSGKEFLGSGNAEIRGRNRTDMRVQVRVKF
jgi:hypothetical protein